MSEKEGDSKVSIPSRPTINLPPRASMETLFAGGPGFSPGPMTLVSNFFSDNYSDSGSCSFSQLLAGAMASPVAAIAGVKPNSFLFTNSTDNFAKDLNSRDGCEKNLGFKQNRPMNLVVAQSPMFMVPSGLSPSGLLNSPGLFSPLQSPFGMSHQQALAHVTAQAAFSQSYMLTPDEFKPPSIAVSTESLTHYPSFDSKNKTHTVLSEPESSNMESGEVPHSDSKSVPPSHPIDKPANDGYNWRKYGQKQVKASDHPRSYYKCTHSNCPVKKKVEHNLDGQIAEITYKGQHNHELPQPTKRARDGSDVNGSTSSQTRPGLGSQGQMVNGSNEIVHSHPGYGSDHVVKTQQTHVQFLGSSDYGEMGDAEIRLDEGDGDEPNPKRRETEVGVSEVASSQKTVSEARIIVQTRSEVDLLDDGYKWRKYGQKVVKGNPHPRSYYKCTYTGCNVRKHVERASTDPKAVITTYEGKHNHDLPAGRNSNAMQVKPQKVVARKPALHKDMDFADKDQMPVLLQLKEEQIIA